MENNNFENILKNIQKIPDIISKSKDILSKIYVFGESGAGLVKVKLNGRKKIIRLKIDPSLMNENKFIIEDLVSSAINNANEKVDIEINNKMTNIMHDLGIPTDFISMIPLINSK